MYALSKEPSVHEAGPASALASFEKPMTVSELNARVDGLLKESFGTLLVTGEISGFIAHRSGHWYFTLKDESGQIKCACFKGSQRAIGFIPSNGQRVIVRGKVMLFGAMGSYQITISHIYDAGLGLLQQRFEQMKAKLMAEGLFEMARKRALRPFIQRVAVITSPDGAAIRDFVRVALERNPSLQIVVLAARVQGQGAEQEVAAMIDFASANAARLQLDALVVTRGGGSMEDLWTFNEESVVRALARSQLPTVSAIGHEIDFTLCDGVADVRAPTPTAAAQIIAFDQQATYRQLQQLLVAVTRLTQLTIESKRRQLKARALRDPSRALFSFRQRIDQALSSMESVMARQIQRTHKTLQSTLIRIEKQHPRHQVEQDRARLLSLRSRLERQMQQQSRARKERLSACAHRLNALSPLAVLGRGYSVTLNAQGAVVRTPQEAPLGSHITIRLHQGQLTAQVSAHESTH